MTTQTIAIKSPRDLFFYDLCVMYDVEQKLMGMLPVLAQECVDPQAKDTFTQHTQETRQHIRNLEQCFQILGGQPQPLENHTTAGLKQDHDAFLQQQQPIEAITIFNLHAGYQSECLEIAAYHNLIDEANILGLQDCAQLFQQNLQQEINASKKLAEIAHQYEQQQIQVMQRVASAAAMQNQPTNQPYGAVNPQASNQPYAATNPQTPDQSYAATNPQAPDQSYTNQQMQGQPYAGANMQTPNQSSNQPTNQSSGAANSPTSRASQLQQGMQVVGSDMGNIGIVKDVRDNDFLVDIRMQRDVYVPFNAIQNVDADRVVLNIPGSQVNDMNWPNPPLM
jgi:ferritin-like metal-binding protein YciE